MIEGIQEISDVSTDINEETPIMIQPKSNGKLSHVSVKPTKKACSMRHSTAMILGGVAASACVATTNGVMLATRPIASTLFVTNPPLGGGLLATGCVCSGVAIAAGLYMRRLENQENKRPTASVELPQVISPETVIVSQPKTMIAP